MAKFRFEDLDIWKMAIEIREIVFDSADDLEERKLFRFTNQLRRVGMSVSNLLLKVLVQHPVKNSLTFCTSLAVPLLKQQIL